MRTSTMEREKPRYTIKAPKNLSPRVQWLRDYYFQGVQREWNNEFTAWNARAHNNANVLTLGSRSLGTEVCNRVADTFLNTPFEGGRHERRVRKMQDVEDRFTGS